MMGKTPGRGSAYLVTRRDEDGDWLDGGHAYRLHVPANPPMRPFWAITLYEGDTRTLLQNETQSPERGSNSQGLQMNADGSVDLYFGPTPPPGKETNWVQTVPERFWFAYFRLYAPTEAYIDRSWPLPDIEKAD